VALNSPAIVENVESFASLLSSADNSLKPFGNNTEDPWGKAEKLK
jgi:hypothetical protein